MFFGFVLSGSLSAQKGRKLDCIFEVPWDELCCDLVLYEKTQIEKRSFLFDTKGL